MKYLADMLTFLRLVLAVVVPVCIMTGQWTLALTLFAVAALSDALDGPCARRWPYTPQVAARLPWRRIDPHMVDNIPDSLMVALASLALAYSISYWWVVLAVVYGVSVLFFVAVQVLARRGLPRAAERTDVVFGWWFTASIVAVVAEMAYRSGHLMLVAMVAGCISLPLLWFKRDRALTRPETRQLAQAHALRRAGK